MHRSVATVLLCLDSRLSQGWLTPYERVNIWMPYLRNLLKKHPTTNILLFHPSGFERESSGSEQASNIKLANCFYFQSHSGGEQLA